MENEQSTNGYTDEKTTVDMAAKVVAQARAMGFMGENDHMPYVVELLLGAEDVCRYIQNTFDKISEIKGEEIYPLINLSWSAYAGIEAVYYWNADYGKLKEKGILGTLCENKRFDEWEGRAYELLGIGIDTDKGEAFYDKLSDLCCWTWDKYYHPLKAEHKKECIYAMMEAMFIFGMAYEMERLGMK